MGENYDVWRDTSGDPALDALERPAVLEQSRRRIAATAPRELIAAVEADATVAVAVLAAEGSATVAAAVEALGDEGVARAVAATPAFDPLEARSPGVHVNELLRLHGIAAARAAERIARTTGCDERDVAVTAALVHDIGKVALDGAADGAVDVRETPEARLCAERAATGTDHAELGGRLARRWGLHERLARVVESHHENRPDDPVATIVRLADMLAHYERGAAIDLDRMLAVAALLGLGRDEVGSLLYEVAFPLPPPARAVEPCPLSARELDVIRGLADGMLYKQIAAAQGLAPSTVRNHLHRAYSKLDVADRAQAVLVAKQRGWI